MNFSHPQSVKRIGIDARFYGPLGKGLGRYTQEIVDRVINLDKDNEYFIFLHEENFSEFIPPRPGVHKIKLNIRWYSWQEQFVLPFVFKKFRLDLLHFPHFNVPLFYFRPFVVTIHDLILTQFPTLRATTKSPLIYYLKNLAYRLVIASAIRRAKKVVTVSEFTRQDIISHFRVNPGKVVVTLEGIADNFLKKPELSNDQIVLSRYNIASPFLLYVGNAYPHKNLEGFLHSFVVLKERNPQLSLVLVGKLDHFYRRVQEKAQELGLAENVFFPGFVPDSDLIYFFRQAAVYVFPSFYEGFGLPPLEAMEMGCPVASSNQSCLPEILADAAVYFNPYNQKEIADVVGNLLSDEKLRDNLRTKGFIQAKKYRWSDCASETLMIYHQALFN